jgi:hypothetical protein
MIPSPHTHAVSEDYIPYPVRIKVTQIDPRLDYYWQQDLLRLFGQITPQQRKNVAQQLLAPQNIHWDREARVFRYHGSDEDGLTGLLTQPLHPNMRTLIEKIMLMLDGLRQEADVLKLADMLENILAKIQSINVEEDLQRQSAKQEIRRRFIYEAAAVVAAKTRLDLPENHRQLSVESIKIFINEIFLKQQLQGYSFKTCRPRELAAEPSELLGRFLRDEQKNRQLEVVRTSKYIYALAPSREQGVSSFSLRRFLREETLFDRGRIYLHGALIDLTKVDEADYSKVFQTQIDRIVTIEGNVSKAIIDDVSQIEELHDSILLPLLFRPLDAGSHNLEQAVVAHLQEYEVALTEHVLRPLHRLLTRLVSHEDECEYLYVSCLQLFGNIIRSFKDFQSQPALWLNHDAELFMGRLVAYVGLLEKRYSSVFVLLSEEEWERNHQETEVPLQTLQKLLQQHRRSFSGVKKLLDEVDAQLAIPQGLMGRFMKKHEKLTQEQLELRKEAEKIQWRAYIDMLRLPRQFDGLVISLEFDTTVTLNTEERNFAFAAGRNGIARLPLVVTLSADRTGFSLSQFLQTLQNRITQFRALKAGEVPFQAA